MFYQYNKQSHPLSFEVFKAQAQNMKPLFIYRVREKNKCILQFLKLFVNHILWENAGNENLN